MRTLLHSLSRVAMMDLAEALRAGRLKPPYSPLRVAVFVPEATAVDVASDFNRLDAMGMLPAHIAEALDLLAAERLASQKTHDRIQLVWTGPEVTGSVSRDTGVVVRELFTAARRSLLLSTFTVHRGRDVFAPLAQAMANTPSLKVQLAVNVGRSGDYSTEDHVVVAQFAAAFWGEHWPWAVRPEVYYDPRALSSDSAICASLHAKCVVVDDEIAFVTSANFTEWAQERNLEAGVLIRDSVFARSLKHQFESLVAAKHLLRLPGSENQAGTFLS